MRPAEPRPGLEGIGRLPGLRVGRGPLGLHPDFPTGAPAVRAALARPARAARRVEGVLAGTARRTVDDFSSRRVDRSGRSICGVVEASVAERGCDTAVEHARPVVGSRPGREPRLAAVRLFAVDGSELVARVRDERSPWKPPPEPPGHGLCAAAWCRRPRSGRSSRPGSRSRARSATPPARRARSGSPPVLEPSVHPVLRAGGRSSVLGVSARSAGAAPEAESGCRRRGRLGSRRGRAAPVDATRDRPGLADRSPRAAVAGRGRHGARSTPPRACSPLRRRGRGAIPRRGRRDRSSGSGSASREGRAGPQRRSPAVRGEVGFDVRGGTTGGIRPGRRGRVGRRARCRCRPLRPRPRGRIARRRPDPWSSPALGSRRPRRSCGRGRPHPVRSGRAGRAGGARSNPIAAMVARTLLGPPTRRPGGRCRRKRAEARPRRRRGRTGCRGGGRPPGERDGRDGATAATISARISDRSRRLGRPPREGRRVERRPAQAGR